MRGLILAALVFGCACAQAAAPARGLPQARIVFDPDLRLIAGWLRLHGRDGTIGADVADAMGIGAQPVTALQRGFRTDDVLRIAQVFEDLLLFMVQQPDDRVYFYLSTPIGGLQKAFLSIPSRNRVVPLDPAEAELRFRHEVLYWKDRSETR
jgi:hypothetical protein